MSNRGAWRLGARATVALAAATAMVRLAACSDASDPTAPSSGSAIERPAVAGPAPAAPFAQAAAVVLVGAADIGHCGSNHGDEKTAALISNILARDATAQVFAAGDLAYEDATARDFANCYAPSWGQFKARTRPAPGNHEYDVSVKPYFDYFGAAAGERNKGYYSYDLGQWHIVVLNSNSSFVSTSPGSAQLQWLENDLQATGKGCVLAYWHHARFRSSTEAKVPAPYQAVKSFWDALYAAHADVVVAGHQHFYERFAPQTPDGHPNSQAGIRQFVVGTGGKSTSPRPTAVAANSEVRHGGKQEFGVLKLTLGEGTYSWEFLAVAGKTFTDAGSGTCHPKR